MPHSFFSIDIGEKYIKIADSEKKGTLIDIQSLAYDEHKTNLYLTDSPQEAQIAADLIVKLARDANVKKKQVNVIIPDSFSYSQILEMPAITEKELLSAIRYQADQFIPISIDKVSMDIEILAEDKKTKKLLILLIASPINIIDRVTNIMDLANITPIMIENEFSATLRYVSFVRSFQKATVPYEMYLNFGSTSSTIFFLGQNPYSTIPELIPLQIRNFPLGIDIFIKDIKVNYNLADADVIKLLTSIGLTGTSSTYDIQRILASPLAELINEINKFTLSIKSKYDLSPNHMYLFGEGHRLLGLKEKLISSLSLSIDLLNPSSAFIKNNVSDFFKNDIPLFAPSLGGTLVDEI